MIEGPKIQFLTIPQHYLDTWDKYYGFSESGWNPYAPKQTTKLTDAASDLILCEKLQNTLLIPRFREVIGLGSYHILRLTL